MHVEMKEPGHLTFKTQNGAIKLEKVKLLTEDDTGQRHTSIDEWVILIWGDDEMRRRPNEIHGTSQVFITAKDMLAIAEHIIKHSKDTQQ